MYVRRHTGQTISSFIQKLNRQQEARDKQFVEEMIERDSTLRHY